MHYIITVSHKNFTLVKKSCKVAFKPFTRIHHLHGFKELATKSGMEAPGWHVTMFNIRLKSSCGCKWNGHTDHHRWLASTWEDPKELWVTTCGHKVKDITPLTARSRGVQKEEALHNPPWKQCLDAIIIKTNSGTVWKATGKTWMGWSTYGLSQACRY